MSRYTCVSKSRNRTRFRRDSVFSFVSYFSAMFSFIFFHFVFFFSFFFFFTSLSFSPEFPPFFVEGGHAGVAFHFGTVRLLAGISAAFGFPPLLHPSTTTFSSSSSSLSSSLYTNRKREEKEEKKTNLVASNTTVRRPYLGRSPFTSRYFREKRKPKKKNKQGLPSILFCCCYSPVVWR